jgi:Mn-dependent DtxR family transcriptional regulator
MKATTAALSVAEAKAIAKDLGVKPEEVVEMETRLTGRERLDRPDAGRSRRTAYRRSPT